MKMEVELTKLMHFPPGTIYSQNAEDGLELWIKVDMDCWRKLEVPDNFGGYGSITINSKWRCVLNSDGWAWEQMV